ncbi:MAG: DinB family protein [Candidatus Thorarchaeota archaeon]
MISRNLAEYHVWASQKYRELIKSISDEDYVKEKNGRTIEGISSHIVAALLTCFKIMEKDTADVYIWLEGASRDELLSRWHDLDTRLLKLSLIVPKATISVPHLGDKPFALDAEDFVLQYILHTIHHRGQLGLILREFGYDVPGTDYLHFFNER